MIKYLRPIAAYAAIGMAFLVVAAGHASAAEPLPLDIGGDFRLTDQRGEPRNSAEFDGKL
jgi:cytochrome oxidase Cu insertion factor (SCO1/SenC/PrrC family)